LLLRKKADVDARTNFGETPLLLAAFQGHIDVVELLLAKNADVNARDNSGMTPLHYALANHHDALADLLRRHGGQE
jgi:ankyrin repeat protein